MLKRNYQIPYVVTEHSTAYHQAETRFGKAQYRLIQAVLNEAHLILPVSEDLGKAIQKMTTRPTQRITNVVDPEVFIPAEKSSIFTLVHISTLNQEHKNPKGILRAVKALLEEGANLRLILISDFPADEVKRYATELTISSEHLSFLGPLNTIEVAQQLAEANALILFSNYENFPCVIAEAFMCGVPVISSRVNGIPEFVNESNGILVEAQDENALKEAIRTTLENRLQIDPAELRNYAISHFSYDAIGRQFSDVYRKTIQECGVK
jgi:glycosyltransferase involved in cell wall biosynthesis